MTPWSRNDFRYAKQNWELNFMTRVLVPKGKKTRISSCFSTIFHQLQSIPKVRTVIWNFSLKSHFLHNFKLLRVQLGIIFTLLKTWVIFHKLKRFPFPPFQIPNFDHILSSHIHSCTIIKTVNKVLFCNMSRVTIFKVLL